MLIKTPQDWADFLGMKVVCFKTGDTTYEYRGIEYPCLPFSSDWLQYLPETEDNTPEIFYSKYRWLLTKTLSKNKYDTIFIPTNLGDVNCLESQGDEHVYVKGRLVRVTDGYLIPIPVTEWDKTIYIPDFYKNDNSEETN